MRRRRHCRAEQGDERRPTEVTGFLPVKSRDDGLLKKVQLHLYDNGGSERRQGFLTPQAIKLARQIGEDLRGWTGSTRLQVHPIAAISTRVK